MSNDYKTKPNVEAPSPGAYRNPKDTIQPGSDSARVFARPASTIADLDERQAQRMVDLLGTLREDARERDRKLDEKIDKKIAQAFAAAPSRYLSPAGGMGAVSVVPNPLNPGGDVLVSMRAKVESIPDDESEDETIARLQRDAAAQATQVGSLSLALEALTSEVRTARKAAPAAVETAATKAAEVTSTATVDAVKTVLTNDKFLQTAVTIVTLIAGMLGTGAYVANRTESVSKEQGKENAAAVERAAKEGAKEAAPKGPDVFIIRTDGTAEPASSAGIAKGSK